MKEDDDSLSDSTPQYDKSIIYQYNEMNSTMIVENEYKNNDAYDPKADEQICCVELINNNKIYISYEKEWTIQDVYFILSFS